MQKFASKNATKEFFIKHNIHSSKLRGLDDLFISSVANGTYLGDSNDATDRLYEEALVKAAQAGCNFFDTAINYRCQRSERNIGFAIKKLHSLGITRDQLVVSTKGGFLPADGDPQAYRSYVLSTFINTGIISPDDIVGNCHCMTPAYLQTMIDLSLKNLRLDGIDLYYLHNPEMQLAAKGPKVFYDDLQKAFAVLEQNVADGKIARYGLATWDGFRRPAGYSDLLEIDKVVACAREVAGDNHHFKAIQLPYNLAMLEAAALTNQAGEAGNVNVFQAANELNVNVMVSAPLMQSHALDLPSELFDRMPASEHRSQQALQFVLSTPGVSAAMVGMKSAKHTEENLTVLNADNWKIEELQNIIRLLVEA